MAGSVLVTGAARGFGRALLDVFLNDGWRVLALTRRETDAERLNAALPERFTAFAADVTSEQVGERIRQVLDREREALKLLVNNAGRSGSLMSIDALDAVALGDMLDLHALARGRRRPVRAGGAALPAASRARTAGERELASGIAAAKRPRPLSRRPLLL